MITQTFLIVGSALIGYKLGWEVGVGAYLCLFGAVRCISHNIMLAANTILTNR